jgi:hypothetical protein
MPHKPSDLSFEPAPGVHRLFPFFEKLLHPYPEAEPPLPPKGFFAFVWACTRGLRGYIALLALLSAAIAAYEAWLFALLGRIVDWLGKIEPARLWDAQGPMMLGIASVLVASTFVIALQTFVKHQTLAINPYACAGIFTGSCSARAWRSTRTSSPGASPPR